MSDAAIRHGGRVDAIGDLLQTLGRAPFDLDAVLATILHQAVGLCRADRGFIYLLGEGSYHHAADVGASPEIVAFNREHPIRPTRGTLTGRTVLERCPVHIPDVLDDPAYDYAEAQRLGGFRAMLGVPMLRDDVVVGVLDLWRDLPQPFTSAEIELVTQFSDGAAIAIELTRLAKTIDRQRSELSRYVSPQVAGLVTSDEGERLLAGHRREITVLFCDLRGFTAFSESAAPEDVLGVLRTYHEVLGARMTEFEGTLERFTGDGIMAFFNDPIEQPDHAERAVRMAVAVRADVASLVESWRRSGFELGLGIGIATGYATLGRIGFRDRVDYAAIGTVVNLAARLCAEATHQQILLPARTYALVEGLVEARTRGDVAMKGFERPVRVVEIITLAADART
jgi:class 3 adenylate cyclase